MTASATTDALAVREQQRFVWDGVAPGWQRWGREFERGAATVTDRLLKLAGTAPGMRVLDVGSGIGQPALSAGRAVAPGGLVVGVDLSPAMIAAARAAADGPPTSTSSWARSRPPCCRPARSTPRSAAGA